MKTLFSTTALVAALAFGGATAQTSLGGSLGLDAGVDAGVSTGGINAGATLNASADASGSAMRPGTSDEAVAETTIEGIVLTSAELSSDSLIGATVYDASGEAVGEIGQVIVDGMTMTHLVVEYGGFLGLGERDILVAAEAATFVRTADAQELAVQISMSSDAMVNLPEFEG